MNKCKNFLPNDLSKTLTYNDKSFDKKCEKAAY